MASSEEPISWQEIRPNLETTTFSLPSKFYTSADLTFIRFSLQNYKINVVRASDITGNRGAIDTITQKAKAIAGINANFFDEAGNPLGLVLSRGIIRQQIHQGGNTLNGVFMLTPDGAAIKDRRSVNFHALTEAIQSGPRLLDKKKPLKISPAEGYSRRSGLCIDESGRILFFVTGSSFFGITLEQLQKSLLTTGIDCSDALNLDGGGSAQMFAASSKEGIKDILIPGTDPIPVALVLYNR